MPPLHFSISELLSAYREGRTTPTEFIIEAWQRAEQDDPAIWISRPSELQLRAFLVALDGHSPDTMPLFGIPFAIKDNIDCAGFATTAACPAWSYEPGESAFVVDLLIKAGAIPMGKTNLDQFATGLVGVRSPYGVPGNAFNADYIPGGSSSGSAVALAKGLCSFSLGTDTAGSGRVPASFNNLVGFKPTRGVLSCRGVVPACRSLDCVSIFALTAADAERVLKVAAVYDAADAYARVAPPKPVPANPLRIGWPSADALDFFGNEAAQQIFATCRATVAKLGWEVVEVDIAPLLAAARLLYDGPWVAERVLAVGSLLKDHPEKLFPVTRKILEGGTGKSAVEAFTAQYQLAEMKRRSEEIWRQVDTLVMPTAGTIYTQAEVAADPITLNSNLGRYTNFMNLLDLCGCAVPSGFLGNGLPWGVTFYAPAGGDATVLAAAADFHAAVDLPLGTTSIRSSSVAKPTAPAPEESMKLAVCGAHLEGLALHWQLQERRAKLVQRTLSAPCYRFWLLPGQGRIPDRPGMVRVSEGGVAIELEVWEIPLATVGSFLEGITPPLGLSRIQLADSTHVCGFVCEAVACETAEDITHLGSWRLWLASQTKAK